jgi:NTE family protein
MTNGAIVFAGGGLAGIAWETGVLRGIQEREPAAFAKMMDVSTTFVGTSAGAAVASQVAGGASIDELFSAQLADETAELGAELDVEGFMAAMGAAVEGATTPEEMRRGIGRMALAAKTVPGEDRMAVIEARLANKEWPTRRLLITAVDADSGEFRVFDRNSGVSLVEAVAASCAVPGVWPTVPIDGRRYMDGGTRTSANVDVAAGSDPVLVFVPGLQSSPTGPTVPQSELDALGDARVHIVYVDAASLAAFGNNPLDPAVRPPAALAGEQQGKALAAEVARFWG